MIPDVIASLPGIGRSTANSIATFCFGAQAPIMDGNVKRVLCRAFGIEGFPGSAAPWRSSSVALAGELMPKRDGATYNQAQMDLGATVCTRGKPRCDACPLADICVARATGRTAELPTPKAAQGHSAARGHAAGAALHEQRVLLETRPPTGIWGGLLSLPELPAGFEASEWASQRFGCRVIAVSPAPARCVPLGTLDHAFSHFRLRISPLLMEVEPVTWRWNPACNGWRSAMADAALPAPVRRILEALQASGSRPLLSRKR